MFCPICQDTRRITYLDSPEDCPVCEEFVHFRSEPDELEDHTKTPHRKVQSPDDGHRESVGTTDSTN